MNVERPERKTFYLFIDESGNFDFSPKGSKYFFLTGLITADPLIGRDALVGLRYRLLRDGINQEYFHASEDKQDVRDKVFEILSSFGSTFEVMAIFARKNKTNPSFYRESYLKKGRMIHVSSGVGLYQELAGTLLEYVFRGKEKIAEKIVVVLGSLYVGDKKRAILQTLKHYLKSRLPGVPFEIYSHQSCADLNCQLADYCCWATAVKWERGETRPYDLIKSRVLSVYDNFEKGNTEYYQYE